MKYYPCASAAPLATAYRAPKLLNFLQMHSMHEHLSFIGCHDPIVLNADTDTDVTLEFELPFWIEEGDTQVDVTGTGLAVHVRNQLSFRRTYWRNRCQHGRLAAAAFVFGAAAPCMRLFACRLLLKSSQQQGPCFVWHMVAGKRSSGTRTTLWWTRPRVCGRWTTIGMQRASGCSC